MFSELKDYLGTPVDGASLALFRALLGLIMARWVVKKRTSFMTFYTSSPFYLYFELTPFIRPYNKTFLVFLLSTIFLSGLCLGLGLFYPYCAIVLLLSYTYSWLMDRTTYNNHYYLSSLLFFLFCFVEGDRLFALDNLLGWNSPPNDLIPYWHLLIFQLQFAIVYTFGGINKLTSDWLVRAQPMKTFLKEFEGNTEWKGRLRHYCYNERIRVAVRNFLHRPSMPYSFSYAGCVVDLFVIWLLLYPPTRAFAVPIYLSFNLFNQWFFQIGYFPIINYAALFLFLDPSWSRWIIDGLRGWL